MACRTGVTKPKEEKIKRKWKIGNLRPMCRNYSSEWCARSFLNPADNQLKNCVTRFHCSQVVPYGNFLPGQAAIILLGGKSADDMVLVNMQALYSELSGTQGVYPNTVMAVMAKWRELYKNASLTKSYQSFYATNRSAISRPGSDRILEAFYRWLIKGCRAFQVWKSNGDTACVYIEEWSEFSAPHSWCKRRLADHQ